MKSRAAAALSTVGSSKPSTPQSSSSLMARTSGPLTRARIGASPAARMARIWWMLVSIPPRRILVVDDERVEIEVGEHLGGLGSAREHPVEAARPAREPSE